MVSADLVTPLTLEAARAAFPIRRNRCYLNNASIGALSEPVIAAVNEFLADVRDNGRNNYPNWCTTADTEIKDRVARLIGARRDEIAFVKNTTEGLVTVANGLDWRDGDNVLVPDIEYPSNVYCWMRLAQRGVELRWVPSRDGRVPVDAIAERMDARTRLVSVSAVQFSNGFRQDLQSTAELCRAHGVLLNVDAIQWLGALPLDLAQTPIDFLSAGGHKWLLSPIGTGIFYCRRESMHLLDPPSVGYHSVGKAEDHMDYELVYRDDAGRFEEALVNFPGIWGLDASLRMFLDLGMDVVTGEIARLVERAAAGLRDRDWDIVSPGHTSGGTEERSGILAFRHRHLAPADVAARLAAARVDVAERGGALRLSPSYYNDADDIDRFLDALPA